MKTDKSQYLRGKVDLSIKCVSTSSLLNKTDPQQIIVLKAKQGVSSHAKEEKPKGTTNERKQAKGKTAWL